MELLNYHIPNYSVEFNYPKDWEIKENYMGTIAMIFSPQENIYDDFRENININVEDLTGMSITLEQYSNASILNLKKLITKFRVLERQSIIKLSGYPAYNIIFQGEQGKLKLQWHSIWTIKKFFNRSYSVSSCSSLSWACCVSVSIYLFVAIKMRKWLMSPSGVGVW